MVSIGMRPQFGAELTLEIALARLLVTSEGDLGDLVAKEVTDCLVRHIAHLVVLLDDLAAGVADATIARLGEGIAGLVARADIAVDARPPFVTFAMFLLAHWTVWPAGERPAFCDIS